MLGSPGSGKTTFCHALAAAGGPPLYHLDDLYWGRGWRRPAPAEWEATVARLTRLRTWTVDGNFIDTVPVRVAAADVVVLFDRHPLLCAAALVSRSARLRRGDRTDYLPHGLAPDDPPVRSVRALLRKALGFRRRELRRMAPLLAGADVRVVRTRRAAAALLAELSAQDRRAPAADGDPGLAPCRCPETLSPRGEPMTHGTRPRADRGTGT
ncbi:hypothetical protein [Streptomyces capillispiralis]|uniref:Adenylate kinase family enzyme n=1 Tax=Streptomyces capillispiralis TaxID=68182 RepID=A0A561TBZ9_9ACTN|nr:hypothetical protein [Streptomyces capillispiralis]TWF84626.1 hypothetical protein FHX78_111561 [Streptomyces capillispiralis]GHH95909.1 hypothetical protein GCM10017779_63660 [Streptomyces capillispiralis]